MSFRCIPLIARLVINIWDMLRWYGRDSEGKDETTGAGTLSP
jgi:hypothetical protein